MTSVVVLFISFVLPDIGGGDKTFNLFVSFILHDIGGGVICFIRFA